MPDKHLLSGRASLGWGQQPAIQRPGRPLRSPGLSEIGHERDGRLHLRPCQNMQLQNLLIRLSFTLVIAPAM
jgi:hypothetical protein